VEMMKKCLVILVMLLLSFAGVNAKEGKLYNLESTQVVDIKDSQSGRAYELYIKLPQGYSEKAHKRYPVIYYTDAKWHLEILSSATEYIIEDVILVGISWEKGLSNKKEHVSRFRDYTILKSKNSKRQTGGAKTHLAFIQNDVFSYVENQYRTVPENRSYFGYSLSGMFGAYILLTQPDTFKNYILGSPTTLGDDTNIYEVDSITALGVNEKTNANVFVSVGAKEGSEMVNHAVGLVSWLNKKKQPNLSTKLVVIEDEDHGSAFPMTAVRSIYWLAERYN
jgi:predicted alpha/beta superfamily hydrolase